MGKALDDLLAKISSGWTPAPLEKGEELRRVRLQISGLLNKILDAAPEAESQIVERMRKAADLAELRPWIQEAGKAAEAAYPGITMMAEWLIAKEAALSKEVPGAADEGRLS